LGSAQREFAALWNKYGVISADDPDDVPKDIYDAALTTQPFAAAGPLAGAVGRLAGGPSSGGGSWWTPGRPGDPVRNAYEHWKKHGSEFPEYKNAKQYVDGARDFVNNSPTGTLTKARPNGDTLFYHPGSNTFAVTDASGALRTMFRPNSGINYWNAQ